MEESSNHPRLFVRRRTCEYLSCRVFEQLHPSSRPTRASWWLPPVLRRGSRKDLLGICFV